MWTQQIFFRIVIVYRFLKHARSRHSLTREHRQQASRFSIKSSQFTDSIRHSSWPTIFTKLMHIIVCSVVSDSLQDLPSSSAHGIVQASILEWVTISFSRGPSRPRDGDCTSCTERQILYSSHISRLDLGGKGVRKKSRNSFGKCDELVKEGRALDKAKMTKESSGNGFSSSLWEDYFYSSIQPGCAVGERNL